MKCDGVIDNLVIAAAVTGLTGSNFALARFDSVFLGKTNFDFPVVGCIWAGCHATLLS